MIKNIIKTMRNYEDAIKSINETYKSTEAYIKANFVKDSIMYNTSLEQANKTRSEALKPIIDNCVSSIKKDAEKVRNDVKKALTKSIPTDVLTLTTIIADMSAAEQEVLVEPYKNNFVAMKVLNKARGVDFNEHLADDLLDMINEAEMYGVNYISGANTKGISDFDYHRRCFMKEGENWADTINDFINTYSQDE